MMTIIENDEKYRKTFPLKSNIKPLINYLFMFHVPENVDNNRLSKEEVYGPFYASEVSSYKKLLGNHETSKIAIRPFFNQEYFYEVERMKIIYNLLARKSAGR